ncbi:hypothetical protein [Periweissella beninensis]|uniref:Phage protein n=1 Tax=Periweissella beninensis TaxID=504936 RepID=A0ABT0VHN9_9LACO|nr:hypothetical protein [Periweissella beninensis]MBM7543346.1 hypothetical protein [Periweissella beninensis]MCM2437357.1 hypothetical protein [Periweissella beninensis]MCT4396019.1 hypothetical protein [Periweissella beninensis]
MDDEQMWLIALINELKQESRSFVDQAFFMGLETMVNEQVTRLEQNTGELDGRIWNPKRWG